MVRKLAWGLARCCTAARELLYSVPTDKAAEVVISAAHLLPWHGEGRGQRGERKVKGEVNKRGVKSRVVLLLLQIHDVTSKFFWV